MSARSGRTDTKDTKTTDTDAEVLYQKLGDRWFAFTLLDGEVFVAPVPEDMIETVLREQQNRGA
jgi:hypothetical protein